MALRPTVLLSLLTFALLAGCSDGPKSGELTAIPGAQAVEGASVNTYVAASYPNGNNPATQDPICPDVDGVPQCTDPSSNYKVHFMPLPEPSGDGYSIVQRGGTIDERTLGTLMSDAQGMWNGEWTKEADESTQFSELQLRMGDFVVATASSAAGSQAFVASPLLSSVVATGSYKGRELDLDVQGLPADVKPGDFIGRFYAEGLSGNLTLVESFPLVAGAQTLVTEQASVGDYVEFHIHVGTSKIYVYQATL